MVAGYGVIDFAIAAIMPGQVSGARVVAAVGVAAAG